MEKTDSLQKSLISLLIIVVIAGLVYYFFFRRQTPHVSYEQQQLTILKQLGEASTTTPKLSLSEQGTLLSGLDSTNKKPTAVVPQPASSSAKTTPVGSTKKS